MAGCCCCNGGGDVLPACVTAGNVLVCNGTDWVAGQVDLADPDAVTGTLGVANGGTGQAAVGAANTVLTSNGVTTSWELIDNANVDAAAAIAVSKLAPGAANTVLTSDGATNSFALIVNANVDAAAAIAVSKLAPGAANTVLTSDGVTNSFTTIVNANIAAGAAIDVTKLALGGAGTVLTSDGVTNAFTTAPSATSFVATSFVAIGPIPATTGDLRVSSGFVMRGRNAVNTLNIDIVTWNASNNILFGNDGTSVVDVRALTNVRFFSAGVQSGQLGRSSADFIRMGGTAYASVGMIRTVNNPTGGLIVARNAADTADIVALTVNASNQTVLAGSGGITLSNAVVMSSSAAIATTLSVGGNLSWLSTVVNPQMFQGTDTTATITGDQLAISAQDVSGNTATTGGILFLRGGDATGTGGTHNGGAFSTRGGDATGAAGTRNGGDWLAEPGAGATADGSLRLRNAAGTDRIVINTTGIGFFAVAPVARQDITGSRVANPALADLLTKLALTGLITDSTVI